MICSLRDLVSTSSKPKSISLRYMLLTVVVETAPEKGREHLEEKEEEEEEEEKKEEEEEEEKEKEEEEEEEEEEENKVEEEEKEGTEDHGKNE